MKYIDADKLIAEIERRIEEIKRSIQLGDKKIQKSGGNRLAELELIKTLIASLQQDQPDFDDVDPKHLVHSHYTKVRDTKTGRVFWAEYSSEAAEWYEAGTGNAYSSSKVEIVKEQPGVDLEKAIQEHIKECLDVKFPTTDIELIKKDVAYTARKFYELGFNTRKEE